MIDSFWVFGGDTKTAVAFIQVAKPRDVFVVLGIITVVFATRATIATRTSASFQTVAGAHRNDWAGSILWILMTAAGIDRETIGSPTEEEHFPGFHTAKLSDETSGKTMIMIGAIGLHMGLIAIQTEIDLATLGFSHPAGAGIALPEFGCPWFKRHSVHRHAEKSTL